MLLIVDLAKTRFWASKIGQIKSVGGGLQHGEFDTDNFKVYGVENYQLNEDGSFKEYLYNLRGINMYKDEFQKDDSGFHLASKAIFQRNRQNY